MFLMKPEISVIVPVYNVEPYLRRCLDSIINQSMIEIEILVIDDGSTDQSGVICDEYAKLDNRVKVIHQDNNGLSHARNVGLDRAQGKYIMFVDSDDYVYKDFCKIPYEVAMANNVDIVIFHHKMICKEKETQKNNGCISCGLKTKQEAFDIIQNISDHVVWNKLFHKQLFKTIRFPNLFFEDIATVYKLIEESKSIYYCDSVLYCYSQRRNSISSCMNSKKKIDLLKSCYRVYTDLNKWGYSYKTYSSVVSLCFRYIVFFGYNSELSNECVEIIESHRSLKKYKIKIKLCYFFYNLNASLFYNLLFPFRLFAKF